MKIDPHKHKEHFLKWKEATADGIPGLDKISSDVILSYISDMESGLNVSSHAPKGSRSFSRLNNLRLRLTFLARHFRERFGADLTTVTEKQLFEFFNSMRNGTVKKANGLAYQSVGDYVKIFKAFWHWRMKVSRKNGLVVPDITEDLDTSRSKPKWVYLTEEQVRLLCDNAKRQYRLLILFLYDTGIRSPTVLLGEDALCIYMLRCSAVAESNQFILHILRHRLQSA